MNRRAALRLAAAVLVPLLLAGCGPEPEPEDAYEVQLEKAQEEFRLAGDYYGAYIERYREFPELAERISPQELALVGYSYGRCMSELAAELETADEAQKKVRAASYYETAGNAFRIAADTGLPAYLQPALLSTVLVYARAVELDGEARPDLVDNTLRVCEEYFAAREAQPALFGIPDDDARVALVKTELLYRRGDNEAAAEFFETYLAEFERAKGGTWPARLAGRLGDETFHAGLYEQSEHYYRRAAELAGEDETLLQRYAHNTRIADFYKGLTIEAAVPKLRYGLLTPEQQADLRRALEHYAAVARDYPEHVVAGQALYRSAYINEHWITDLPAASRLYARVVDEYPEHELASTACFRAGLCAELGGDYERAAGFYERLEDDYDDSPEAPLVGLRRGIMLLDEDPAAARGLLEDFIDETQGRDAYRLWVGEAYAALGELAEEDGDGETALELYTRAVENHGFREGVRYGSERIAHAYLTYAEQFTERFGELELRGSLEEVQRAVVELSELRNKLIFGYSGADAYGDLELSIYAKYRAGQVFESFAVRLQDTELTSGGSAAELEEIYYQINYPTRSFFIKAREAYRAALDTVELAGGSPLADEVRAAHERLTRLIGPED